MFSVVTFLLAIIGFGIYFYALFYVFENIRSKSWTKTKGVIVKSNLISLKNNNSNTKKQRPFLYKCEVEYTYDVLGKKYANNKILLRKLQKGMSLYHNKICDYLEEGKEIIVFYSNRKPQKSLLVHESSTPYLILMFVGLFMAFLGVVLFFDYNHRNLNYILDLIQIIN